MNALADAHIICPPVWNLAIRTAHALPRPDLGRVYFIAFRNYFKVGSSHRVYERFCDVIPRHHRRKSPYVSAVIGAETRSYRKLEKRIHELLLDVRYRATRDWQPHEYYPRHQEIEAALMQWFTIGSPDDISLIEAAVRSDLESAVFDSPVPCCWKCGAPQRQ